MIHRTKQNLMRTMIICSSLTLGTILQGKNISQAQADQEFDISMRFNEPIKHKDRQTKANDPITQFCKELYYKNNPSQLRSLKDSLIPKIVHIIWVGPKTPPPILYKCLESIKKHLPHWKYKVWTDKDIPALNLYNQHYYDEETNYGAKADILRYELLYRFGGVYLDIDMVVQKPLDILNHTYEFYTGLHPSGLVGVLGNAIIASIPGHPILKQCLESIKDHRNRPDVITRTGPIHFGEAFFEVAKKTNFDRVIALPASYFYPLDPSSDRHKKPEQYLRPESFTDHFFANSWVPDNVRNKKECSHTDHPAHTKN